MSRNIHTMKIKHTDQQFFPLLMIFRYLLRKYKKCLKGFRYWVFNKNTLEAEGN